MADSVVRIARIGRPFGQRGEVHLQLLTDRPREVLAPGKHRLEDGREIIVKELTQRGEKWTWRIRTEGPAPRMAVRAFTNAIVVAEPADLPARPEGEYSEYELAGCEVVDESGAGIGILDRVETRGEVDGWVIRTPEGVEADVAALAENILSVDVAGRKITVRAESVVK